MSTATPMGATIGRRAARRRLRERNALRLLVVLLLAGVSIILFYITGRAHFAGDGWLLVAGCGVSAVVAAVLALLVVGTNSA
jgi:peptidoglycan/LPS O-acetylase OafA/YrhL